MPTPAELMAERSYYNNTPNTSSPDPDAGFVNLIPAPVRRIVARVTERFHKKPTDIPPSLKISEEDTSQTGISDTSTAHYADNLWRIAQDRVSIYRDLDEIDRNEILANRALTILADCTTGYEDVGADAFEWELETPGGEPFEILNELKDRVHLGTESWHIVRNMMKYGFEAREVVTDAEMVIRRFVSLPGQTIFPNTDDRGNKIPGWYQQTEPHNPNKRIPFQEWQIIPFNYGPRNGYFGTGLMTPARRTYRRLEKMQDGMTIARLIRAYDRLLHRVPVKPEWDQKKMLKAIVDYKANMTTRNTLDSTGNVSTRNNPFQIETDIYIGDDGSGRGGVEILSAENTQLYHVEDVEYHQRIYLASTGVPRKYLNMGRGEKGIVSDGAMTAEDVQFARTLRNGQAVLRGGIYRLGWLALFFQGYNARDLGLRVRMPKISTMDALMDAKVTFTRAQAAEVFANLLGGLPPELVATKFMELDEDEQDILRKFIDKMEAEEAAAETEAAKVAKAAATVNGIAVTPSADGAVRGPEAQRRAMRRGISKRAGRQLGERPVPRVQDEGDYTLEELSSAFTALQMKVQGVLENAGIEFGVGEAERFDANVESLVDTYLGVGGQ